VTTDSVCEVLLRRFLISTYSFCPAD